MIFLAVDSGGTHTRLLLGELCATGWRGVRQQRFLGHEYPGWHALLAVFGAATSAAQLCQPPAAARGTE